MKKLLLAIGAVLALGACGSKHNSEPEPQTTWTNEQKPFLANQSIFGVRKQTDFNLMGSVRRVITRFSHEPDSRREQLFVDGYQIATLSYYGSDVEKTEYSYQHVKNVASPVVTRISSANGIIEYAYNELGNPIQMRQTKQGQTPLVALMTYDYDGNMAYVTLQKDGKETVAMPFIQRDAHRYPSMAWTYNDKTLKQDLRFQYLYSQGRLIQSRDFEMNRLGREEELYKRTYTYDARGLAETEVRESLVANKTYTTRYSNYAFDERGSWTSRECEQTATREQAVRYIETREIVYAQ